MAKTKEKKTKPTSDVLEKLENPEVIQEKYYQGEEFVRRNRNIIFAIVGGVIALVAAYLFFGQYQRQQNAQAQEEMFPAVYYYEQDSLALALNGDGNVLGLLDIIDEYGSTEAANLAHFYAGSIYLQQGEYDQAIEYLQSFSAADALVQARAYALEGDAHLELADYPAAADAYERAANYRPNKYFTPAYLMKKALAQEQAGDYAAAAATYDRLLREYPAAAEANDAKKYKALAEAMAG